MKVYGAPYPLEKTPLGIIPTKEGIDAVKADLLMLLLTNPGERVMLMNYGTALRTKMFEPNDAVSEAEVKKLIWDSITMWEPRISIESINVTSNIDTNKLNPSDDNIEQDHILGITISFFDPSNITAVEKLSLEVPI